MKIWTDKTLIDLIVADEYFAYRCGVVLHNVNRKMKMPFMTRSDFLKNVLPGILDPEQTALKISYGHLWNNIKFLVNLANSRR